MENLTIVIPFRDGHATIQRLLDSLPSDLPVIVVDDLSKEPLQLNRENTRVVRLEQRGYFSGAINRGIQECDTDVLVLNQDVWFDSVRDHAGLIANHREQFALIGDGVRLHPAWPEGYVQGTFMFMRRDAINKVGLLNERDYPLWGATCEWQLRVCRAGFKTLPTAVAGLLHERGERDYGSSITQALKDEPEKQSLLIRTPPAISVVIAAHNYGHFLRDAVKSLVGGETYLGEVKPQTFQSFEIILVDYGSTDDTWQIMQSLANPRTGIHAIQVPDEGTAEACNAGIQAAHGKYIAMLDADDMMEPERLEQMYRLAEQNPHSVIFDDIRIVHFGQKRDNWTYPEYDFEQILEKNTMHKGLLFPKKAWEETGGYPKIMTNGREDWAFNIALGLRGWCGIHLPQPFYLRRQDTHNRSSRNTNPMWHQKFLEQLHYLYPKVYAGERPMGCCGGTRRRWMGNKPGVAIPGKPLGAARKNGNLPGENGLVLLEYDLPDKAELRMFHGKATGIAYWFGILRKRGYVAIEDAPDFLSFMYGRAFKEIGNAH